MTVIGENQRPPGGSKKDKRLQRGEKGEENKKKHKVTKDVHSHPYLCIKEQPGGLGGGRQVWQGGKDTPGNLALAFTARSKPDNGTHIELSDRISASLSCHLFILAESPYSPEVKKDRSAPSENIRHVWDLHTYEEDFLRSGNEETNKSKNNPLIQELKEGTEYTQHF